MRACWDDFRLAISFLTVFPVGRDIKATPEMLGRSMGLFPAVGLLLGLGLCVANWMLQGLLPRAVLDCLLVLLLIAATGALHLDGVADLFDGLAGGKDRASMLEIMKDSRVGAIGVVGLVMVLLLKYLSLYHVPLEYKNAALIFMPAAGRWMQVCLCCYAPYVRSEGGTGSAFVENVGQPEFLRATATLIVASLVLFSVKGIFLVFLLGIATMLILRYFESRLGGVTGDVLGAVTEMVEVLVLLLVLATFGS
ncbi:adenosylcobinamide-GDP ribazoletransferase [Geopsychrobacter electrodiphilus]|uniref:adenosylcobinamide-GDP ribazoletransferase n=1 Tax=Geopsychrobacter electrodiphilus TaxID=225196 RepID=UPI00036AB078|nr:adenosylcobinamide-GDP ribazoletransferase [Geopsychrobacter electrodiphilus]